MKYIILNLADITDQMIADCQQSSRESLRKSIDGTKALLKYVGAEPASLSSVGKIEYTSETIHAALDTPEWQSEAENA